MTVVVACHYLKTAVVVADCRVSYGKGANCVDDNLLKLYPFSNVILGFAGPLKGANEVVGAVRENYRNYSKPKIASNLISDMERWIKHAYRDIDLADRKNLQFILAAVEPNREPRAVWRNKNGEEISKPEWASNRPEIKIISLKPPQSNSEKLITTRSGHGLCHIIGVGTEIRDKIARWAGETLNFSAQSPKQQARVLADGLMAILMKEKVETVGGLFQIGPYASFSRLGKPGP